MLKQLVFLIHTLEHAFKMERRKEVAIAVIELVLELHPMQTQCVQERRQPLNIMTQEQEQGQEQEKSGRKAKGERGEERG